MGRIRESHVRKSGPISDHPRWPLDPALFPSDSPPSGENPATFQTVEVVDELGGKYKIASYETTPNGEEMSIIDEHGNEHVIRNFEEFQEEGSEGDSSSEMEGNHEAEYTDGNEDNQPITEQLELEHNPTTCNVLESFKKFLDGLHKDPEMEPQIQPSEQALLLFQELRHPDAGTLNDGATNEEAESEGRKAPASTEGQDIDQDSDTIPVTKTANPRTYGPARRRKEQEAQAHGGQLELENDKIPVNPDPSAFVDKSRVVQLSRRGGGCLRKLKGAQAPTKVQGGKLVRNSRKIPRNPDPTALVDKSTPAKSPPRGSGHSRKLKERKNPIGERVECNDPAKIAAVTRTCKVVINNPPEVLAVFANVKNPALVAEPGPSSSRQGQNNLKIPAKAEEVTKRGKKRRVVEASGGERVLRPRIPGASQVPKQNKPKGPLGLAIGAEDNGHEKTNPSK